MKFGDHLKESLWPYWRSYYVDYKALKECLESFTICAAEKAYLDAAKKLGCAPHSIQVLVDSQMMPVAIEVCGEKCEITNAAEGFIIESVPKAYENARLILQQYAQECLCANQLFRSKLDGELAKVELFFLQQLLTEVVKLSDFLRGLPFKSNGPTLESKGQLEKSLHMLLVKVTSRCIWLCGNELQCPICKTMFDTADETGGHTILHVCKPLSAMDAKELAFCGIDPKLAKSAALPKKKLTRTKKLHGHKMPVHASITTASTRGGKIGGAARESSVSKVEIETHDPASGLKHRKVFHVEMPRLPRLPHLPTISSQHQKLEDDGPALPAGGGSNGGGGGAVGNSNSALDAHGPSISFKNLASKQQTKSARATIRKQFRDHLHNMELLMNFCILNQTAFVKILKKMDKMTGQKCSPVFQHILESMLFVHSLPVLKKAIQHTEDAYVDIATVVWGVSRKKVLDGLRMADHEMQAKEEARMSFWMGLLLGVAGMLIAYSIFEYFHHYPSFMELLPSDVQMWFILRWTGIPIFLFFLFALNGLVYEKYRINYAFIYGLNPTEHTSSKLLVVQSMAMNVAWLFCLFMYIRLRTILDLSICGYLHYPCLVLMGIVGLAVSVDKAGAGPWFWNAVFRMFPPRWPVRFADFFIADQLTSIGPMLYDTQFITCIWTQTASDEVFCSSKSAVHLPVLSAFPHIARMLQCLRRFWGVYRQDRQWAGEHLWNAGKYFSSIAAIAAEFIAGKAKVSGWPHLILFDVLWVGSQIISTIYKTYWDLRKDWGLCRSKAYGLRSNLTYPRHWYYIAMVVNVLIRWSWALIMYLRRSGSSHKGDEWFLYLFPLLEVTRRGMWNLFRVENEYVNNCGKFRPSSSVPIPVAAMKFKHMQEEAISGSPVETHDFRKPKLEPNESHADLRTDSVVLPPVLSDPDSAAGILSPVASFRGILVDKTRDPAGAAGAGGTATTGSGVTQETWCAELRKIAVEHRRASLSVEGAMFTVLASKEAVDAYSDPGQTHLECVTPPADTHEVLADLRNEKAATALTVEEEKSPSISPIDSPPVEEDLDAEGGGRLFAAHSILQNLRRRESFRLDTRLIPPLQAQLPKDKKNPDEPNSGYGC